MTGINRQPDGLSDLVRVQAGGKNPDDLSQQVRPTIDIAPFYEAERLRGWRVPFSLQMTGFQEVIVPDGEIWNLRSLGWLCDNVDSVSEFVRFSVWIEQIPGQGFNGILVWAPPASPTNSAAITNGAMSAGNFLPRPYHVRAGMRVVLRCDAENINGALDATGLFFGTYTQLSI